MKKWIVIMMCVAVTGAVWAAEGKLGVDVDIAWASKYIWRGLDLGDNKAAFQPSINFDLWGSGFSANVWGSWLGGDTNGAESALPTEELDYSLTYANSLMSGDAAQVDYALTWTYYNYYTHNPSFSDMQDLALALSMPKVFGESGFVPKYTVAYSWSGRPGPTPGAMSSRLEGAAGFVHIVGLDYNFTAADLPMTLSASAVYNDGTYGTHEGAGEVDHDWSHIVWGWSTSFKCPLTGAKFTPGIYYQTSMDDSVNKSDEFWTTLSYKFSF
jgi:hypothetical protein